MNGIKLNSNFVKETNFKSAKGLENSSVLPINNGEEKLENESRMSEVLGRSSVLLNNSSADFSSEEKSELKKKLKECKNQKDEQRFYDENIDRIVELANKNNIDFINYLIDMKSLGSDEDRFNGYHIRTILEIMTDENADFIKSLIEAQEKSKEKEYYRFNAFEIIDIAKLVNRGNIEFAKNLIYMKSLGSDEYRFDSCTVMPVLKTVNPSNIDLVNRLIDMKVKTYSKEEYRFDSYDIETILKSLNQSNTNLVNKLIDAKETSCYGDEEYRFDSSTVTTILSSINESNIDLANRLIDMKLKTYFEEGYRFTSYEIETILKYLKHGDVDLVNKLVNAKEKPCFKDEEYRFYACNIASIVEALNKDNAQLVHEIIDMKNIGNQEGENRFSENDVLQIVELSNKCDIAFLNELIHMKEFTRGVEKYKYNICDFERILNMPMSKLFESSLIDENTIYSENGIIARIERLSIEDRRIALKILNKMDEKGENPFTLEEFVQIIEQIKAYKENNNLTEEDIDKLADDLASLNKKDKEFILANYKDNKYYSPKEFFETFLYFKNLKTDSGINIFGLEEFYNKIEKYGLGDETNDSSDNKIYENLKAIMDINPSSTTASYLAMMIDLIKIEKVNASALRKFESVDNLLSFGEAIAEHNTVPIDSDDKWSFSPNLKNDIDKLCETIARNTDKTKLEDEIKDAFVPTVELDAEGIKRVAIGETYQIKGEKHIRIKTSEDSSESLNLSKETYLKLFPPVDRFSSSQQVLGDCYCLETMMLLYSLPNERIKLLKLFNEDDENNISIKLPTSKDKLTFENGEIDAKEMKDMYSSGADGFKMLEMAYASKLIEDRTDSYFDLLSDSQKEEFLQLEKENPNNVIIYKDENGEIQFDMYDELYECDPGVIKTNIGEGDIFATIYPTYASTLLGSGGSQIAVLDALGYDKAIAYFLNYNDISEETILKQIEKIKNNSKIDDDTKKELIENLKASIISIKEEALSETSCMQKIKDEMEGQSVDLDIDPDRMKDIDDDLINKLKNPDFYKNHSVLVAMGMHAYSLTYEKDEKGQDAFYVYNPHSQGIPILLNDIEAFFNKDGLVSAVAIA